MRRRRKSFPELEARERAIRESTHAYLARHNEPRPPCTNCGEIGSHFFPACMGESGFFVCTTKPDPSGLYSG